MLVKRCFHYEKGQMDDLSICLLLCKLTSRDNNTRKNNNHKGKLYNFTFDQLTKNPQIFCYY